MNGPPRKQVIEELDRLRREIQDYHRYLAEFPDICLALENLCLRVDNPLPGSEQSRYLGIGNLRDKLRTMRSTTGVDSPSQEQPK